MRRLFRVYAYAILVAVLVFIILQSSGLALTFLLMKVHPAFKLLGIAVFCAALYVSVNLGRRVFDKHASGLDGRPGAKPGVA